MEAMNVLENDEAKLKRWNLALAVLAWGGIAWVLFLLGKAALGYDFAIGLMSNEGLRVFTADDFTPWQRLTLVAMVVPPDLCWIYCLFQIARLSRCFSRSPVLSHEIIRCLERFGFGLAAQALFEMVCVPLSGAYLVWLGKVDSVQNVWQQIVGGGVLSSLLAAVLIVVITNLLRIGLQLREEAELTI